jgi:hypothetical protein
MGERKERKLRSGVNCLGALKQQVVKQSSVKRTGVKQGFLVFMNAEVTAL